MPCRFFITIYSLLVAFYFYRKDLQTKTKEAAEKARAEAKAEEMERLLKVAKADKHNIVLYNECLNRYTNSMQKSLNDMGSHCDQSTLYELHESAKSAARSSVCSF